MNKPVVKISASEVLSAIRSGVDDQTLMVKYNLNYRQLQVLFRKMIKAGYVTPLELAKRLCVTESQVTEVLGYINKARNELD